ncbi:restriction endonuclease [uncultured Caulobacter sp.]|jgi:restriction system protein|uniref:restriction endonuclease n=1 Tax=uncultured Caulobacter sp. TaxID=158749 RepID=UPI0026179D4A|nr:restriction endonuclease [uncultured Caulobacter sp.]
MPVPDYETLMLPVLRLFAEGAKNISECVPRLKEQFGISDEEARELIPSGRITVLQSRAHWARTYLSKAGLLHSPKRNLHVVTDRGLQLLATNPERIDNKALDVFEDFRAWRKAESVGGEVTGSPSLVIDDSQTPEEAIASAHAMLSAALRDELLALLQDVSPQQFERLILDLLAAMGYGGGDLANGLMTKATGDNGIDGIINEDALGLDAVYIQAKRYAPENKVSRPDIQRFVGSLTGEGANKGVFVTTSDFSREAREYLIRVQHRIVLINGATLAKLMIQHGVGVRARSTYVISSVDEDYFSGLAGTQAG